MMDIVDSISSITMDTPAPIAMIFVSDWTTVGEVVQSVMEVVIVLRDVGEEFAVSKSGIVVIVGSNPIEFELNYNKWIVTHLYVQ
ncbi:MAG: hypothetical protein MJE68_25535 [Proteobacteria bacterium]|nr:hypothetical protein [Pseudomonadota bacterium]